MLLRAWQTFPSRKPPGIPLILPIRPRTINHYTRNKEHWKTSIQFNIVELFLQRNQSCYKDEIQLVDLGCTFAMGNQTWGMTCIQEISVSQLSASFLSFSLAHCADSSPQLWIVLLWSPWRTLLNVADRWETGHQFLLILHFHLYPG